MIAMHKLGGKVGIIFYAIFLLSCQKTEYESPLWENFEIIKGGQIQALQYAAEEGKVYGVGGKGWDWGSVFAWEVESQSLFAQTQLEGPSLLCFYLDRDFILAGGLEGTLVLTDKQGQPMDKRKLPLAEIRGLHPSHRGWEVIGLDNFTQGKALFVQEGFTVGETTLFDNALKALAYLPQRDEFLAGGYGLALSWMASGGNFTPIPEFSGDQIEAIAIDREGTAYWVGYGGGIFSRNAGTGQWQRRARRQDFGRRNPGFRTATWINHKDCLVVAGERGHVYFSKDGGRSWGALPAPKVDFLSSTASDSLLFLGGRDGILYTYPLAFL
jgi:hypothetical protein